MAGDWIKIENVTPNKPEVIAMAESLGIDQDAVIGKLIRLWIWADEQTFDGQSRGNVAAVTQTFIDRYTNVAGFAEAMIAAGWLEVTTGGLVFPNFDRHNGQTAKTRALTSKRVAVHRGKKSNAPTVTKALPEKRREEKSKKKKREEKPKKPATPFEPLKMELPATLDNPFFQEAWELWVQHRIDIKHPLTPTSVKLQFTEFVAWGVPRSVKAIKHTIKKQWRGIREPEQEDGESTPKSPKLNYSK